MRRRAEGQVSRGTPMASPPFHEAETHPLSRLGRLAYGTWGSGYNKYRDGPPSGSRTPRERPTYSRFSASLIRTRTFHLTRRDDEATNPSAKRITAGETVVCATRFRVGFRSDWPFVTLTVRFPHPFIHVGWEYSIFVRRMRDEHNIRGQRRLADEAGRRELGHGATRPFLRIRLRRRTFEISLEKRLVFDPVERLS